jgi:hypothetical protein
MITPVIKGVCVRTQHFFEHTIHALGLTIRLWVVSRRHSESCSHHAEHLAPEGRCESWIPIRDDLGRHTMETEDRIHEDLRSLRTRDGVRHCCKMHHLTEPIYKHEDAITSSWIGR